ncbi:hypothetical protein G9A89_018858 [Geosiphon pyriformis]|nr:hypothetical protein G9A89_018858 [Geosiphon pyriformis]
MNESSDVAASGEIVVGAVVFNPLVVLKMEETLRNLSVIIMSLSAKMNNAGPVPDDIICWHKDMGNLISIFMELKLKRKMFTSGLDSGYLSASVFIVMDFSLARHVCKVSEVFGRLLYIKLLFKNKLSVFILGLYAGASSAVWFSQASEINSLITRAVNEFFFVILSGDFNKDGSHKCVSFKKCLDLGLVNSLVRSLTAKMPTWANSKDVEKTINYLFISSNLINTVVFHGVFDVNEHFDTDYQAVSVSLGLGGLLDTHLISLYKQANKDHWKFDIKNASKVKWSEFRDITAVNAVMFLDAFGLAVRFLDLDTMWNIICKIIVLSANSAFKKKWFKNFDGVFTKESFRFHKLKLLVSKLVKALHLFSCHDFVLNSTGALMVKSLFLSDSNFNLIYSALARARKFYCTAKLLEFKCAKESYIKQTIARRIESFEFDKGHIIRNVLEHPFYKVVLDHLVPDLVKSRVDKIMGEWTRKHKVVSDLSTNWVCQFQPLDYVFNGAFSGVMCSISLDEMCAIIKNLPDKKTAGLSGISNEFELVFRLWKNAWESVLTNTHPIALIETVHKIFSKVFSDNISSACNTFNILHGNNFLVLKSTTTQSLIFAIGSVVEDVLKKNRELWLEHLRRSLVRIKICDKFIRFFGNIHIGHINRVMTDFGLTNRYHVHDRLDQGKVFSSLLWCIFYDLLLCKVKRQKNVCDYRVNSNFISKTDQADPQAMLTLFLAAGVFVDDIIWVGSSQTTTQHILNIAITNPHLAISGLPISITKKGETYHYLGIFLSTKGLSKLSLAKAYLDIWFFVNLVLRKVILDKQFAYLVFAVLLSIVSYKTQFSFVPISVCNKWDALICKDLKSKSGLPFDFPNDALYHPLLYNLKTFEQIQAESKSVSVINFANSVGILGCLFSHRSHNLQVLSWHFCYSLLFPARVGVNSFNNYLAGVVHIFSGCDLSLNNSLACVFHFRGSTSMSIVLGKPYFLKCVLSLKCYGIAFVEQLTFKHWKRLDSHGLVPLWFDLSICFLRGDVLPFGCSSLMDSGAVSNSLCGLGTSGMKAGAAVFFQDINSGLSVRVSGLVFFTLIELQAIALTARLALDACKSESLLACSDFRNQCWIEHHHITDVIHHKNLSVNWFKVKGHSGVLGNECTDALAENATFSAWQLPHLIGERFLRAGGTAVFGNSRHFICNIFWSVHCACWKVELGSYILLNSLHTDITWLKSLMVWHMNFYLAAGFTSMCIAGLCTYFMKALYHWLPVVVHKHLYNKCYSSVICLFCGDIEVFNHVFCCLSDAVSCARLLDAYASVWEIRSSLSQSFSCILQLLLICVSDVAVDLALYKGFVFNDWYYESVSVFRDPKIVTLKIVGFVREFCLAFRENIWLVHAKHQAFMDKNRLISHDNSIPTSISGLSTSFSAGVVRLLGIAEAFGVGFEFYSLCSFFSGIGDLISVHIGV